MWAYYALMAALAAYGTYSAITADSGKPERPPMAAPDFAPLQEFTKFTDYQNDMRNNLLSEYYGGTVGRSNLNTDFYLRELGQDYGWRDSSFPDRGPGWEWFKENQAEWTPAADGSRRNISFNGQLPAIEYAAAQNNVLANSQAGFSGGMDKYLSDRGILSQPAVEGAQQELNKSYKQRALDINSRSHDIYAMTLGSLFGEVSDAGQQSGQLVGNVGLAAQSDQQARNASYQQAMQKWQYDQSRPSVAQGVGTILPYLYGMMAGGSGGAGSGYGSAGTNLGQLGYNMGSGGSNYKPPGMTGW